MARRYISGKATGYATGKFGISVTGVPRLIANIEKRIRQTQSALYVAMLAVLLEIEGEAKRLIAYGYYKPAIDTSRMINSITSKITEFSYATIEGVVGTSVYYAIYVHEGVHKTASQIGFESMMDDFTGIWRMPPRPFMTDALKNKEDFANKAFANAVKKELIGL